MRNKHLFAISKIPHIKKLEPSLAEVVETLRQTFPGSNGGDLLSGLPSAHSAA